MARTHAPRLPLARLVRRAEARRAAVAALSLAAAGPALAQAPVPVGGEFRVNTSTAGDQLFPSSAVDADGDFVVTWTGSGAGDEYGVYARRYAASGAAVGPEFRVNTYMTGFQSRSSVALDADGDMVVVWAGAGTGDDFGVYAQRYAASGAPVGGEFRVNTFTTEFQANPSVAVDADGDLVVVWDSKGQDGSSYGVYGQRYAASGAPVGPEFRVNTYTTFGQRSPSVAVDADGDFVVAWTSGTLISGGPVQDGSSYGIYAQRYAASGAPVGAEFRVNTYTTGGQYSPSVATDVGGDFVVAWTSYQDGDGYGIYAQRYTSAGAPVGGEFLVNTYTAGNQRVPSVALDADGDMVVAWETYVQDGSGFGVYAQRYAASGAPVGPEFRVNTFTAGSQRFPSVAVDADGDLVVAWAGYMQDGSGSGVYAQRYASGTVASEPGAVSGLTLAVVPSPVGPSGGRVRYALAEAGRVRLSVLDVLGREVAVLADGEASAGAHEAPLDTGRLAPGVYAVRLTAGASSVVRRVTVAR